MMATWGYKELALDRKHLEDIVERKEAALNIFFNRKNEIDEYFRQTK